MAVTLDNATEYGRRGWHVVPLHAPAPDGGCTCGDQECGSPAKHPRTRHGLKDATTDTGNIEAWWRRWPDANIGITTGADSGLVVLDIDPAHGGDIGLEQLETEHGRLPDTLIALTGGEGMHYLFRHPGTKVRNSSSKLGPGVDTRGDGGYIVAPPSRHQSGRVYEWLDPAAELADLPEWIVEKLETPAPVLAQSAQPATTSTTPYAKAALDARAQEVAFAAEGTRNETLNQAAFRMGQLVAGGQIAGAEVEQRLSDAAHHNGLAAREIAVTIRSGLEAGARDPQYPEPPAPRRHREPGPPSLDGSHDDIGADEPGAYLFTDLGNAHRLVAAYGDRIRYVPQHEWWLTWRDGAWRRDITGIVDRMAKTVVETIILPEAENTPDDKARKNLVRLATDCQRRGRLVAMTALARTEEGIPVEPEQLDSDPWLLNVRNGTIDLRTGKLRPHEPGELHTKQCPVDYNPDAVSDLWETFLTSATNGDNELREFLRRAVGYSLTGSTREDVLFFVHGPAAAGKSTFTRAIEAALGDYAVTADFETFLARNQIGGARGDIARLAGNRYVLSTEVHEGAKLAEGLVKTLTGGDTITTRFMYGHEFEFKPGFKLWLVANNAPRVRHGDDGMWRRILRIPFTHAIAKKDRDDTLRPRLCDPELTGAAILAWAVSGCLAWQQHGLAIPESVIAATDEYRAEQDPLGEFLADRCILKPGWDTYAISSDLRGAYDDWCRENGQHRTLSPKAWSDVLIEHGCQTGRRRIDGKLARLWYGVRLRTETDDMLPDTDQEPL